MNENLLNELLRRGMQTGDLSTELNDAAVDHWLNQQAPELPDAVQSRIKRNLKLRMQDAAFQHSVESLSDTVMPLGQLILTIRERAGVSRSDVAERLGKPDEFLKRIEENDADFPNTSADEFVTLMEIFQLRFSKVSEAIHRSCEPWSFGGSSGWQGALAIGLKNDKDKERTETGATTPWQKNRQLSLLAEKKKAAEVWLVSLQSALRKKNRTDLLG